MEKLQNLIDVLGSEEETFEERDESYNDYRQAAIQCERKLREQKKIKHRKLLERISVVEAKLKHRNADREKNSKTRREEESEKAATANQDKRDSFDFVDQNSNYVNSFDNTSDSKDGLELIETFSKLEELKNQEMVLESWYGTMSEQLEQEQKKLTEKFQEMQLKLLHQKQHYLKTSQEFINNLSSDSRKAKTITAQRHLSNSQSSPQTESNRNSFKHSYLPSKGLAKVHLQRSIVSEVESSLSSQNAEANEMDQMQFEHVLNMNDAGRLNDGIVKDFEQRSSNRGSRLKGNDQSVNENTSGHELSLLAERTYGISPIQRKTAKRKEGKRNEVRTDLKTRFGEHVVNTMDNISNSNAAAVAYANISSSTPVSKGNLSERSRSEYLLQESTEAWKNNSVSISRRSGELVVAAARGHLTRKLMKTDKVQELIKTIKDTRAVLSDMATESKVSKRLHESKADALLKATIKQELQNAQNKFHSIFLSYSPAEKVDIIQRSRATAADREIKHHLKEKNSPLNQGKRLSTVTRKTLRRKQETSSQERSVLRPRTSPAPTKNSPDGKKQRKSWDIRSVKPTPSDGSPFHYLRSRDRIRKIFKKESNIDEQSEASLQQKEQKVALKKSSRKKVLAANLNRKVNSTNG